ncbi:citrinin polyketide synthase [Coccidioides immitis H538.4]|uniref:Citrinin polyketide synthase n=1 Tax=Coccidioides immitis H538.4 TaxID=396776 RepID=A0A0J8UHM7_COCIT|nr:citrinin polyketide synthase [Coccidioides immitis H538.4]
MATTSQSLLIFGSQIAYSEKAVSDIKTTLQNKLSRQWVLDTVAGLPKYWDALAEGLPKVTDTIGSQGRQLLEDLGPWLESNGSKTLGVQGDALPGVVFVPLIVLEQLTEYRRYLQASSTNNNDGGKSDPQAALVASKTPALGFCMGLLGAYGVASAHDLEELDRYGAVAVRLAMLAGALSDAQDTWNPHRTYAWRGQMRSNSRTCGESATASPLKPTSRCSLTRREPWSRSRKGRSEVLL